MVDNPTYNPPAEVLLEAGRTYFITFDVSFYFRAQIQLTSQIPFATTDGNFQVTYGARGYRGPSADYFPFFIEATPLP